MTFTCANHQAMVYRRGGVTPFAELTPLTSVRWQRIRDDVSSAEVVVPTNQCCEIVSELRTVQFELHIYRGGVVVWQGPIVRLEYEWDVVRIFAEDVLWTTKRCVLTEGYNQAFPNIGKVIDRMEWLLHHCYSRDGDPWNMISGHHIHPIRGSDDPNTSRQVNAYQLYVWDDLDKYAEDYGADYTVINRDVYFYDTQLKWKTLPDLSDAFLSQFPRIVEYGNQAATRGYVTNGQGYAGIATADDDILDAYGHIDWLITNQNDGEEEPEPPDPDTPPPPAPAPPSAAEIARWADTAKRNITERWPPPVGVVIPANTTLLPGAPWEVEDLIPGAWFRIDVTRMCREVVELQRLHEVVVTEEAPEGEQVNFTAVTAPSSVVEPEE